MGHKGLELYWSLRNFQSFKGLVWERIPFPMGACILRNNGIAELRNKQKSHSKYFVIVYGLYNVLIYIPYLVENTITMAPTLGAIFK